jgi:hypothetical protein
MPVAAKARRSVAPFDRLKYFNHKIILASIEPRADAFRARQDRVPKGQAGTASPFCIGEFSPSRPHAPPQTFPRGTNLAY